MEGKGGGFLFENCIFQTYVLEGDFLEKPLMCHVNPRRPRLAQWHLSLSPGRKRRALIRATHGEHSLKSREQHWNDKSNSFIRKSEWNLQMLNTDFALDVNSVAFLPHLSLKRLTRHHRFHKANLRNRQEIKGGWWSRWIKLFYNI